MAKKDSQQTKVTRISASDDKRTKTSKSTVTKVATKKSSTKKSVQKPTKSKNSTTDGSSSKGGPLGALTRYLKGAWYELRQVHWPTRGATWGLTGAVLAFSIFFIVFIALLDIGFKYLFEIVLK